MIYSETNSDGPGFCSQINWHY